MSEQRELLWLKLIFAFLSAHGKGTVEGRLLADVIIMVEDGHHVLLEVGHIPGCEETSVIKLRILLSENH